VSFIERVNLRVAVAAAGALVGVGVGIEVGSVLVTVGDGIFVGSVVAATMGAKVAEGVGVLAETDLTSIVGLLVGLLLFTV